MRVLSGLVMGMAMATVAFGGPNYQSGNYQADGGYDPQAIMNSWQGRVLNMDQQPTQYAQPYPQQQVAPPIQNPYGYDPYYQSGYGWY